MKSPGGDCNMTIKNVITQVIMICTITLVIQ